MKSILLAIVALTATAMAADVSGEWKATAEGPNGQPMTRTFTFKVDGTKLTGETVSSIVGKSTIDDGKVEGDVLTFSIHIQFQGNEMTSKYRGTVVSKDKIIFKIEGLQGGEDFEWVANRTS
jgi:hypothetical protein